MSKTQHQISTYDEHDKDPSSACSKKNSQNIEIGSLKNTLKSDPSIVSSAHLFHVDKEKCGRILSDITHTSKPDTSTKRIKRRASSLTHGSITSSRLSDVSSSNIIPKVGAMKNLALDKPLPKEPGMLSPEVLAAIRLAGNTPPVAQKSSLLLKEQNNITSQEYSDNSLYTAKTSSSQRVENFGRSFSTKIDLVGSGMEYLHNESRPDGIIEVLNQVFRVVYPYSPELSDELKLQPGELLTVHQVFDDGWCFAKVNETETFRVPPGQLKEGICPKACLEQVSNS